MTDQDQLYGVRPLAKEESAAINALHEAEREVTRTRAAYLAAREAKKRAHEALHETLRASRRVET